MLNDLTVIFITANEHPESFTAYHKEILLKAVGDFPLITISRKDIQMPGVNILDIEPHSHLNMYRQILKACKLATTPYIGIAESDTLYPPEHFTFFRPPLNTVAYDFSRWSLFTWKPVFNLPRRISNATLIAPREYYIEALEERYGDNAKCRQDIVGEVGRHIHESILGIKLRNCKIFWCNVPSIQINHSNGISYHNAHHPTRKRLGVIQANEIPFWGRAENIVKEYK